MGLTVVDAGVIIGLLDRTDSHHDAARTALHESVARGDRLLVPASALAEVLVAPSRRGGDAVEVVLGLVERVPLQIVALDQPIAVAAAALRAQHPALKLPDALIVATASVLAAETLLTTDRRWPAAHELGLSATVQTI
jgi:predicted nucleic acid-binding protein